MAKDGRYLFSLIFFINLATCVVCKAVSAAEVEIIAILDGETVRDSGGTLIIPLDEATPVALVGRDFSNATEIAFTTSAMERGDLCDKHGHITRSYPIKGAVKNPSRGDFSLTFARKTGDGEFYYICVQQRDENGEISWVHQGSDKIVRFAVAKMNATFLPIYIQVAVIAFCLCLSSLFSGLNLGLMALDKTELKLIERCGSDSEKKYARVISPLRERGNFLLCTLLVGNVLVNNTLTILLDNISNGLIAVIGATVFIVVFGEIIPQAICSRHGLAVGARTRFIMYFFMILTFPVTYPVSLLLDKVLGEEIGQVYNREKLQELIRVTKDKSALADDEVNIISGALSLSKKTVLDIMTRIEDVFMLEYNTSTLNFEIMSEIMKRGYSRIPVYDNDKSNIVALLNIKDLALIDPDDNTPLKTVCKFYQHHLIFVFDDHKLGDMLNDFRQGHSHLAIVRRVNNEGDGDPFYETLGVVTLEDVIEELIQSEIMDETDTLSDNIKKAPRSLPKQDFSMFNQPDDLNRHVLSPQLAMAAFQFLSTSVDPFLDRYISERVLKKLIKQNIVVDLHSVSGDTDKQYLYKEGIQADYFVLILQGNVEISIGREKLAFNGGPFTYYGVSALIVNERSLAPASSSDSIYIKHEPYIPDFTVRATENLLFMRVKRAHYLVARRATLMARDSENNLKDEEAFTKEWTHFNNINNKSNNSDETSVEVYQDSPEKSKPPPAYPGNWTPIQSSANLNGLKKRTDSRDSGWSFPASDKHPDVSLDGSEPDTRESKLDTSSLEFKFDATEGKGFDSVELTGVSPCDKTSFINDEVQCDTHVFGNEEQGDGESTPLVGSTSATGKKNSAAGDSNV